MLIFFAQFKEKAYFCKKNLTMDKKQDIAYFLSFCIEQYKNAKHLSGSKAMEVLNGYGVLEYLAQHYETLHTQSHHWLIEDIDEYISLRKNKVS